MGFWSTVGGLAKGAVEGMAATTEEAKLIAEDYRREDDEFLKRKLRSGSMAEKMAATRILKERGYGNPS